MNSTENGKNWLLGPSITNYIQKMSVKEPGLLRSLREYTYEFIDNPIMQISPEEGKFLSFLIKLTNSKFILEIGVFTGYSTMCMAQSIPKDGIIIALDNNREYTDIAKQFWKEEGVEKLIDLRIGNAVDTLDQLMESNQFDFAFIEYTNQFSILNTLKVLIKKTMTSIMKNA